MGGNSGEARLQRLEEAQAFDERAIEELGKEVRALGERVMQLAAALKRVEALLAEEDDAEGGPPAPGDAPFTG